VALVVAHTFTRRIPRRPDRQHCVVTSGFRGHGGRPTEGPDEVHDLDTALRARLTPLAFSMDGSDRDTAAVRRLFWSAQVPHGRPASHALDVRVPPPVAAIPPSPLEVVHRVAPTPLLLVHGGEDHYVGVDHPPAPHRATEGRAEPWLERGLRRAATATTPALVDRLARWPDERTATSRAGRPTSESERTAA
jgi:uncharacterized protein